MEQHMEAITSIPRNESMGQFMIIMKNLEALRVTLAILKVQFVHLHKNL